MDIVEMIDDEMNETDREHGLSTSGSKRRKTQKCRVCGMNTYQKDRLCVLCKTGIRKAAKEFRGTMVSE